MVIYLLLVKVQLVELCKLKVEVVVAVVVKCGGVRRVIHRSVCLYQCVAGEKIRRCIILRHSYIEIALYAFVLLKL